MLGWQQDLVVLAVVLAVVLVVVRVRVREKNAPGAPMEQRLYEEAL